MRTMFFRNKRAAPESATRLTVIKREATRGNEVFTEDMKGHGIEKAIRNQQRFVVHAKKRRIRKMALQH